jgi:hypothetical protein
MYGTASIRWHASTFLTTRAAIEVDTVILCRHSGSCMHLLGYRCGCPKCTHATLVTAAEQQNHLPWLESDSLLLHEAPPVTMLLDCDCNCTLAARWSPPAPPLSWPVGYCQLALDAQVCRSGVQLLKTTEAATSWIVALVTVLTKNLNCR